MTGISGVLRQYCSSIYSQFSDMSKFKKVTFAAIVGAGIGGLATKGLQGRIISKDFLGSFSAMKVASAIASLVILGGSYLLRSRRPPQKNPQSGSQNPPSVQDQQLNKIKKDSSSVDSPDSREHPIGESSGKEEIPAEHERLTGEGILVRTPFKDELPVWLCNVIRNSQFPFVLLFEGDPMIPSIIKKDMYAPNPPVLPEPITFYSQPAEGSRVAYKAIALTLEMETSITGKGIEKESKSEMIKVRIAWVPGKFSVCWKMIFSDGSPSRFLINDNLPSTGWFPNRNGFRDSEPTSNEIPFDLDQMLFTCLSGKSYNFEQDENRRTVTRTLSIKCPQS